MLLFNENKVYLTEDVPEHIADFFKEIMPDFVLIIYEMFNPICPYCGAKLHRHEIKDWEMNKKHPYSNKDINALTNHALKQ